MAFPTLQVVCGFGEASGYRNDNSPKLLNLGSSTWWSEAPSTGVVSSNQAVKGDTQAQPVFSVLATTDCYLSVGPVPDSTNAAKRIPIQAGVLKEIFVKVGDRFMWQAA